MIIRISFLKLVIFTFIIDMLIIIIKIQLKIQEYLQVLNISEF